MANPCYVHYMLYVTKSLNLHTFWSLCNVTNHSSCPSMPLYLFNHVMLDPFSLSQ